MSYDWQAWSSGARSLVLVFALAGCTDDAGTGTLEDSSETGAAGPGVVVECVPPPAPAFDPSLGEGRWDDFEGSGYWDEVQFGLTPQTSADWSVVPPTVPYNQSGGLEAGIVAVHILHLPGGRLMTWEGRLDQKIFDLETQTFEWHPLSTDATPECMAKDLENAQMIPDIDERMEVIAKIEATETFDLFCAGHALAATGEVIAAGGNYTGDSTLGSVCTVSWLLDTSPLETNWNHAVDPFPPTSWTERGSLDDHRWYPTLTLLPDGRLTIVGGAPGADEAIEIYDPESGVLEVLQNAPTHPQSVYPHVFVLPNGHLLWAGGETSTGLNARSGRVFNINADWSSIPVRSFGQKSFSSNVPGGSAVSYLPGKIMKSGGGADDLCLPGLLPTNATETIDLSDPNRDYEDAPFNFSTSNPMNFRRHFHSMTLLPDGKVVVTGGNECGNSYWWESSANACEFEGQLIKEMECTSNADCPLPQSWRSACNENTGRCRWDTNIECDQNNALAVCPGHCFLPDSEEPGRCDPHNNACYATKHAELWDPTTGQWHLLAEAQIERMYHSTATLLPDGRVLTAGNGRRGGLEIQREVELYYPPYLTQLADRPRPRVASAPEEIGYNGDLVLQISLDSPVPAESVTRVTMVALGSATHQNDMTQRFVELGCVEVNGDEVTARSPHDSNHAPPGWYMVFAISDRGTPSIGRYLLLEDEVLR